MACVPPLERPLGDLATCSGQNSSVSGQQLYNYWCQHDCPSAYAALLQDDDGVVGYNPTALATVQGDVADLFSSYLALNSIVDSPASPGYNSFQETLLQLCLDPRLPGACDEALNSATGGWCSGQSRNRAASSPAGVNFCGCYYPPGPETSLLPLSPCGNAPCDPLCHRVSTVQRADPTTGSFCSCPNNVCVIDDVTVSLTQSLVGSVDVVNLCPYCGTGTPCTCLIAGVSVGSTLSLLGLNDPTRYAQYCSGPDSLCLTVENGTVVGSSCSSLPPAPSPLLRSVPWVWIAVLVVGLLLVALFFLATRET